MITFNHVKRKLLFLYWKNKELCPRHESTLKTYNFDLEVDVWIYETPNLIVIRACVKYGVPMSKHKEAMARTQICTQRRTDIGIPRTPELCIKSIGFIYSYRKNCYLHIFYLKLPICSLHDYAFEYHLYWPIELLF